MGGRFVSVFIAVFLFLPGWLCRRSTKRSTWEVATSCHGMEKDRGCKWLAALEDDGSV
jgi:hypothetical protein